MVNSFFNTFLAIVGVILTLVFFFIPEYAVLVAIIVAVIFVAFAFGSTVRDIERIKKNFARINEKLKIHEQLVEIKADVNELKRINKNE